MQGMFEAVREIVESREDAELVYPMHLNPAVREKAMAILGGHERIHLIEPLTQLIFIISYASLILFLPIQVVCKKKHQVWVCQF